MKRIRKLALISCLSLSLVTIQAKEIEGDWSTANAFKHLDLSVTLGTTGIGLDLATSICKEVQIRTGFTFMPHFSTIVDFGIEGGRYDSEGKWVQTKFETMVDKLEEFTGYKVDSKIDMNCQPTFTNFKFLVDVFPFRNTKWHLTTGFYWGPSSIAKAYNTTEDMVSLMSVGLYNRVYDKIISKEPIIGEDTYLSPDLEDKFLEYGRLGIHIGDRVSDGTRYLMEPNGESMVKANIIVNNFKPYLGFGYGGKLLKDNDDYNISFDCGLMMWGGTPQIITHDGTDLAKDVKNIKGKVGRYVDAIKSFKAYPVISLRLTRRLF